MVPKNNDISEEKIRKMKNPKKDVENVGTRQGFSPGNPEIALRAFFAALVFQAKNPGRILR